MVILSRQAAADFFLLLELAEIVAPCCSKNTGSNVDSADCSVVSYIYIDVLACLKPIYFGYTNRC